MIWSKIINFIARYWHWFIFIALLIVISALSVKTFDSSRVYIFGPADKVTVRVK